MAIFPAPAKRRGNSLPRYWTTMSFVPEGNIFQFTPRALTSSVKSGESVTVCFWPAIVQAPLAWETLTMGAPQSARGTGVFGMVRAARERAKKHSARQGRWNFMGKVCRGGTASESVLYLNICSMNGKVGRNNTEAGASYKLRHTWKLKLN